jgi:hypothetical protein
MVSLPHDAAPAQAVEGPRQEKVAVEVRKLRGIS